jgi:acetyltransferase
VSGAEVEGILVQEMAAAGVEVMAGLFCDPQFGPVLACGPGGVLVELMDEVALRLPPLSAEDARRMIAETRLARLLAGWRGRPPADVDALAGLLVKLSRLAVDTAGQLAALDLNPVIVLPQGQGVAIVDVRVTSET